jgi:predicted ArsR family transcriptional regulator
MRARVVQLYDAGRSAPDIARELGLTRQAVYAHLDGAGRDLRAAGRATSAHARKRFTAAWNAAPTIEAAAEALGLSEGQARARANALRSRGLRLKQFPPRPPAQPSPRRDRIEALWRQGVRDV